MLWRNPWTQYPELRLQSSTTLSIKGNTISMKHTISHEAYSLHSIQSP